MPSTYTVMGYRDYTARQGDCFDLLAGQAYGQETMAGAIIAANPDFADVTAFEGGELLRIPVVDTVETPDTLPPWRRSR